MFSFCLINLRNKEPQKWTVLQVLAHSEDHHNHGNSQKNYESIASSRRKFQPNCFCVSTQILCTYMYMMMMIMIVGGGWSDGIEAMTHYYVMTFRDYWKWGWILTSTILYVYRWHTHTLLNLRTLWSPTHYTPTDQHTSLELWVNHFHANEIDNWRCALAVILCCACVSSNVVCRIDIIVQVHRYYIWGE